MKLYFYFSDDIEKIRIPEGFKELVKEIQDAEEKKIGEICFIFVTQSEILEINRVYLKHDYVTDVITFDQAGKSTRSGDIYICLEKVKENAKDWKTDFREEYIRVMIHGILHILGYKDYTLEERVVMRGKEDFYIGRYQKMRM